MCTRIYGLPKQLQTAFLTMLAVENADNCTLGRPEQLWFQNNNIHPPQTTQVCLGNKTTA